MNTYSPNIIYYKDKDGNRTLRLILLIILFLLFSGCSILTQQDKDEFNREYKRFHQQPEPYIPSPRDFKK